MARNEREKKALDMLNDKSSAEISVDVLANIHPCFCFAVVLL